MGQKIKLIEYIFIVGVCVCVLDDLYDIAIILFLSLLYMIILFYCARGYYELAVFCNRSFKYDRASGSYSIFYWYNA